MKIIISPAKKMTVDTDTFPVLQMPAFLEKTEKLKQAVQKLSYEEAKELWKCNDKLAQLNYTRFHEMDLEKNLTPAVLAYEGLQYQHIAPQVLTEKGLQYLQEHLRILSGFYGMLSPFDGVVPYRLEMQAKLAIGNARNLYEFWDDTIYQGIKDKDHLIINLASKEYSIAVQPYLQPGDQFVTVEFGELRDGKLKQKGTFAKMARGEMVRFMAENQINNLEVLKEFHEMGLGYVPELSDDCKMSFAVQ